MSNVWGMRYRILQEDLAELADRLSDTAPAGFDEYGEYPVRLLATTIMLLRQHQVNKRGQCRILADIGRPAPRSASSGQ